MEKSISINKQAQIWGMDLVIAGVLFTVAITLFYIYSINTNNEGDSKIQSLTYEGGVISDAILSSGYPEDWQLVNVIQPGILTDGKINDTKLQRLYTLTQGSYPYIKKVLNTPYDFYFFLDVNMTLGVLTVDGIGKPGYDRYNTPQDNLIKISRITVYQGKVVGATIYVWG